MKDFIIKTLRENVKRNGIDNLIQFLEDSDFFKAPASTKFHGACKGGLVNHSVHVYNLLVKKNTDFLMNISLDTLTIAGLLHDVCKINYYVVDDEPATAPQISYLKVLTGEIFDKISKTYASKLIEHYKGEGSQSNAPDPETSYKINDTLPFGHGEKSVYMLNKFIALTDEEALAIRWHMGPYSPGMETNWLVSNTYNQATIKYPLIVALFTADYESSKILNK